MPDQVHIVAGTPVAELVLARPERRNALSLAMMRTLIDALGVVAADPTVRVVVLSGEGTVFSAGHDIAEMVECRREEGYRELFSTCTTLMTRLHEVPQPVIAKVQGVATAAGCQLVAACDLAVAADDARFATPGVNIGLFCSTPMVPLSRNIGRKRALEMLFTGDMIDASTALEWGLVNRVVPAADLDHAVRALADRIVATSGRVIALGKQAFYAQEALGEEQAYALACGVMVDNALTDDAAEGMRAFLEKRPPVWPAPA
jgi:enoyl-CoA hydratase/carnithine racemase